MLKILILMGIMLIGSVATAADGQNSAHANRDSYGRQQAMAPMDSRWAQAARRDADNRRNPNACGCRDSSNFGH